MNLSRALALHDFKPGDHVMVCAKDDFFAFVDGWRGNVTGTNSGLVVVECQREDGTKTLFVPADELRLTVPA